VVVVKALENDDPWQWLVTVEQKKEPLYIFLCLQFVVVPGELMVVGRMSGMLISGVL